MMTNEKLECYPLSLPMSSMSLFSKLLIYIFRFI